MTLRVPERSQHGVLMDLRAWPEERAPVRPKETSRSPSPMSSRDRIADPGEHHDGPPGRWAGGYVGAPRV